MDNATRLQYLEAMDVDVWVPRKTKDGEQGMACLDAVAHVAVHDAGTSAFADAEANVSEAKVEAPEWQIFEQEVAACRRCDLCESRNQTVFGSGNQHADWMLVGEAPGQSEDQQGLPFVGRAGQLLTEMLRAMGLNRNEVFITNILKCRPPGNRDPRPDEVQACNEYLQRQIALIKPKMILAVGRIAAQKLLNTDAPLAKLRGKLHYLDNTPVLVIYHPAYLLRSLLEKRKAWGDLQIAMKSFHDNNQKTSVESD